MRKKKTKRISKDRIFCGGICEEWKRHNIKCIKCKRFLCKKCTVVYRNQTYCKDCVVKVINIKEDIWRAIIDVFSDE